MELSVVSLIGEIIRHKLHQIFSLIPIVSSSGEAGYCLDTSPDAIENMVLKWESRIAHLQQKVQNYPTT
jgi:hypothetical protein